jgi:hypothetical protein
MREMSLRQAWNGEELRAFRRQVRESRIFPGCHGCCNLKYIGNKAFGLPGVRLTPSADPAAGPAPVAAEAAPLEAAMRQGR